MNLEEIKKLYEECKQNVDALAFEMAIPVAELMAHGAKMKPLTNLTRRTELAWKTLCETTLAVCVTQTWKKCLKNMRGTL